MNTQQQLKNDPWQRALGDERRAEAARRRPRPGPGRHRPEVQHRLDAWQRALTGPPITPLQRGA